jgi:predicted lipoprotein with Yx(FWY)xxD motif
MLGSIRRTPVIGAALIAIAATATVAIASSPTLNVAKVDVAGRTTPIVVDSRGVTVYELGNESLARLLCVTSTCLKAWPPVRVSSAHARVTKASGVPGKLTILHRVKGKVYQLMLDRHPLYYYVGDYGTKGKANGQNIKGPGGGDWRVVTAG